MPTITIMQGLPGSGKSYHAERIGLDTGAIIVSADTYPGLYGRNPETGAVTFNPMLIGPAHGACLRAAIEGLQAGRDVVVDNTNTDPMEVERYVALAQAYDAAPVIVRVACDPDKAFARNTHGIPRPAFDGMVKRLAEFTPAFYWKFVPGFESRTIPGF